MSDFKFDVDSVDDEALLIPKGAKVKAVIVDSDIVERDWGVRMPITAMVVEGEYEGRTVSDGFNLQHNSSPQAQAIGQKQLKRLCVALGIARFSNTDELHNKPFWLTVGVDPARGDFDARNKLGRMEKAEAPAGFQAESPSPASPSPSEEAPPWEMK